MFSYVLKFQNQTPRPKTQGAQNTMSKTRAGGDSHSPTPAMPQPCPLFCGKKRMFSHALKLRNQNPRSQAQGPDSMDPWLQGRSPRPQGPSSELQNLVLAARAHASYQKFIKSEGAHCAQRRTIFGALTAEQGRKPLVPNSQLQAAANDFL